MHKIGDKLINKENERIREHYSEHFKPDGIIFVFSSNDKLSFLHTCQLIEKEQLLYNTYHSRNHEYPAFQNLTVMLVGNKCDVNNHSVGQDDILNACSKFSNALYVETSAKDDVGISDVFNKICLAVLQKKWTMEW